MPFIRGRYHINPVLGEALEAAREAEAALLELDQEAQRNNQSGDEGSDDSEDSAKSPASQQAHQRIHRVEIEAAEMVPSHSGSAKRGFVARVHRQPAESADEDSEDSGSTSPARQFLSYNSSVAAPSRGAASPQAETHVFSDHRDLVTFLRDELAQDCKK